jgi:hypothetical protein
MPTAAVLAPRHAELPRPAVIDVGWAELMSHRAYLSHS